MTDWENALCRAIAFARITQIIPNITDPLQSPVKGALVGLMLPGLHLLTIVSVLDEALADYVEVKDVPWPPKTRKDLFNRIDVISKEVTGLDAARLHHIREMRNAVAHQSDASQSLAVNWESLEQAIATIVDTFVTLGMIEVAPCIVGFYERDPTLFLDEPGPNGERMRHRHRVGAKVNDRVFLEYSHEIAYFPPNAP